MHAGNIRPKVTFKMDYLRLAVPPFSSTDRDKRIIVRPHQSGSVYGQRNKYVPPELKCPSTEIDCVCTGANGSKVLKRLTDFSGTADTLLWLDPRALKTECLASLVFSWMKVTVPTQNAALGIVIPEGDTIGAVHDSYTPWKADVSGPIQSHDLKEPIWYPSLSRNYERLEDASKVLDPYDVFPLVESPDIVIQLGETTITDHAPMLEQHRTRTRNFIFLDVSHPDRTFEQFYGTLEALPKSGSSVFQPVITPGGSSIAFVIALLSGVLADAYFFTPKEEIPISPEAKAQGLVILRKST